MNIYNLKLQKLRLQKVVSMEEITKIKKMGISKLTSQIKINIKIDKIEIIKEKNKMLHKNQQEKKYLKKL